MERKRVIDRDVHQVSEFPSLTAFLNSVSVQPGILTIHDGDLPIDLLVSPGSSDTTICFFHGAIEKDFVLPVLSGMGISGGLEANRVFVSDPSLLLDESLLLSWYAGNLHQPDLQRNLTAVFSKIFEMLGSKRVIFFGGSGGGFASLYFASQITNSLAVVFNPQTNIARYSQQAVRDFAEKSFQLEPGHDVPLAKLPETVTTNVCDLYKMASKTQVAYIQNLKDETHIKSHFLPFLQSVHSETEVLLLARSWREGHSPPPKELLAQVLDSVVSADSWSESLIGLGFIDIRSKEFLETFPADRQTKLCSFNGI